MLASMTSRISTTGFLDTLRRNGRRWSTGRGAVPGWLPRVTEILFVLVLAWLAVQLVYAFAPGGAAVTPMAPAASAAGAASGPADLSVFQRFDPFAARGVTAIAEPDPDDARETSLNITLSGIWAETDGTGLAIIEAGNSEQHMFEVGDEIMNGVMLDRLYPDRAIIMRDGRRESVFLEGRDGSARPRRAAPAPVQRPAVQAEQPAMTAESLSSIVAIRPVRNGTDTVGYEIFPRGQSDLFSSLGFVEGDRIVALNGTPAPEDSERLIEYMQSLQGEASVTVRVDRGGEQVDLTIDMSDLE